MMNMLGELFRTSYAPHGYCLLWQPWLIWTHAISDGLIALAYFSIPLALITFLRKRQDVVFGGIFWMFAVFILACGATHILSIWNLWHGDYGAEAVVKAITAVASIFTAILLWPLLPKAIALPSPARLREANAQLSARIGERDSALAALQLEIAEREKAEAALLQARKMEAVGQLTGGIAHDFNNLLQVVSGSLDLIASRTTGDERLARLTDAALGAVQRGKRLTSQLLAFSEMQRLELKPIDVPALVTGMSDFISGTITPAITLKVEADITPYIVVADPVQLELAILHLVLNARDAMPLGGTLTIGVHNRRLEGRDDVEDGDFLAIGVTDTGAGMSPEIVQRVFEPFFTTKEVGKGSGLGLSMVFGMTRQSGGTVTVESRVGAGSTVTLYMRRTSTAFEIPAVDPTVDCRAESPEARRLDGLDVLVVDDEPEVREVIALMLEELGCSVLQAEHGQQALQMVETHQPAAMVIDFMMPGMSGAEIARATRSRWPDIRLVFATGFSQSQAITSAIGEGAIVLRKPFAPIDLADALTRALA
jgi:signal transduction histidine kinase